MYRFSKKLKALKPVLKSLSRAKLRDLSNRVAEAYTTLCNLQKQTYENPSPETTREENQAYTTWDMLSDLEEGCLRQKSKLHWLQVGDKNNKYFHNSAKSRMAMNSIREIHCADGRICTTSEDIKDEAVGFFENFLKAQPVQEEEVTFSQIQELTSFRSSAAESEKLTRLVTEEEIKRVLFSMPRKKLPGPDGFTVEFFTATWTILGKDFVVAVQSFFQTCFLPKGVNTTILALIPKTTEAKTMKDYRPISCCNVIYKVISKILANRLQEVLPSSIAPNQSAFIKDRLMMENLLLASELVKDYHKNSISSRCALKIDISKAFDSVNWSFMLNILRAMALPDTFIHWIKLCVCTATFSVQVNGELAGFFGSERGLRQGCSLSPYLFVICMNILTCLIDKAAAQKKIGYHPRCKDLGLTDEHSHLSHTQLLSMLSWLGLLSKIDCQRVRKCRNGMGEFTWDVSSVRKAWRQETTFFSLAPTRTKSGQALLVAFFKIDSLLAGLLWCLCFRKAPSEIFKVSPSDTYFKSLYTVYGVREMDVVMVILLPQLQYSSEPSTRTYAIGLPPFENPACSRMAFVIGSTLEIAN